MHSYLSTAERAWLRASGNPYALLSLILEAEDADAPEIANATSDHLNQNKEEHVQS